MIRFSSRARVGALVALLIVLDAGIAFSQVVTGAILGRVTDTTGAVVPGATVQIQNGDTGFSRTVQSDSEGRYLSRNLPLGSYTVTGQQEGFQTQVRRGIVLTVASEVVVNMELAVGAVQERVEVTAEAPAIETTTATLSGLVSQEQIRDLPLNGRNLVSLTLLSPGVSQNLTGSSSRSEGMGMKLSVNGGRPDANLYLLDGTVLNDHSSHGPGSASNATLGVEGVLEFRVLTHNFSAEYGRNSGGVISAVTRSGTNEFHGSAYEFVRNNIFDARNFFNPGELPPFRRNQFGASLGGPVIRDRMFFFANYEGLRERQGNTFIASVPDADARRGVVAGQPVTLNPVAVPYLNLSPLPNGRNFGDGTAEFISAPSDRTTEDYAMERMDFRLSDKDNLYWRYVYNPSERVNPGADGLFNDTTRAPSHFAVLSETHIFSGASLNEFRFSFNRTDPGGDSIPLRPIDPSLSFVRGQNFGSIIFTLGPSTGSTQLTDYGSSRVNPQHFAQNRFQANDTVSTVRGAHSLKFGVDLERIQINLEQGSWTRGGYSFGGLRDLLAGVSSNFRVMLLERGSFRDRYWRQTLFGWFVQDDFRLRSNLTLNLGLRHEFVTNPSEKYGRSVNLRRVTDPKNTPGPPFETTKANFSPRLGLAWDPTGSGKTSVRLGAGMYFNHLDGRAWYHQATNNADYVQEFSVSNPVFPNRMDFPLPATAQKNRSIETHLDTPTAIHYNLELQRQVAPTLNLRAAYVGSYGYQFPLLTSENIRIATSQPDGSKFFAANAPLVNPNFADLERLYTDAHYNYNGLQVALLKSVSAGLRFQASYTLSKALSDSDESRNSVIISASPVPQDKDDRDRDYSLSGYDQRHTLTLNGQYQLPWDNLLNGRMARAILGGWAINGIYRYGSGAAFTITTGFNNSQNRDPYQPDRPNLAAGFSNNPIDGVTAGCPGIPAGQKLHTPERWFDPCAVELPAAGTFGNLGRNTVTAPGLSNFDFTLVKTTALTEQKRLEFRAEFFNLFNHANFWLPNTGTFNTSRLRSGNAARITQTSTSNRQIQLGLKLIF